MGPHVFFGSRGALFRCDPTHIVTTLTRMSIRELRPLDWPEVARIYEEGMLTCDATFETSVPSWETWDEGHLAAHRPVVTLDGDVVGWAALSAVSDRECYRGVAEHSTYVAVERDNEALSREMA